jgi:hypothetical protein
MPRNFAETCPEMPVIDITNVGLRRPGARLYGSYRVLIYPTGMSIKLRDGRFGAHTCDVNLMSLGFFGLLAVVDNPVLLKPLFTRQSA